MSTDPTDVTTRVIAASIRADPHLADPSRYVRAFASFLNDRQPEAEKSTPETEWRRMRDLWGGLRILGKGLVAMTRELEQQKKLSVDYDTVFEQLSLPDDNQFDPFGGQASSGRGADGGGGNFKTGNPGMNLTAALTALRKAVANIDQLAQASASVLDLYIPGMHSIAEDVYQLAADVKARIDALPSGGGGSVDNPMTSDLDAGGFFIHNMADAVAPNDGTTLQQVNAGDAATLAAADAFATAADAALSAILIHRDGSVAFTADQPMGTHKITGLATGTVGTDAVNKTQMDAADALSILADGSRAYAGNQSMGSHELTNLAAPSAGSSAATKTYVDNADSTNLALVIKKDGSVAFTGDQSMGSHVLTNVTDPTNAQDAATKAYADTKIPKSTIAAKGDIVCGSASSTPTVLTAGADNRALIANSGKSNGLDYGGAPQDVYNAGTSLVDNRYDGAINCSAFGTATAPTIDTLYAYPVWIKVPLTVDRIGTKVTVAGGVGSKLRFGIYANDTKTSPKPGALIYGSAEFAGTSAAVKEETPGSGTFAISTPGLYWFAVLTGTAAPTLQTINVASIEGILGIDSAVTARQTGWSRSQSYGALPDPFGGSLSAQTGPMFQVFIRIAWLP